MFDRILTPNWLETFHWHCSEIMTPEHQRDKFEAVRQRVAQLVLSESDAGRSLEAIGASLSCYVPRLIRHLTLDALLCISQVELSRHYDFGSWAIGDLVLLLERLADELGVHAPEPALLEHASVAGGEIVGRGIARSIPIGPRPEIELAATELSSESSEDEQRAVTDIPSSRRGADSDVNGDELLAQFEVMRQVLETHAKHPLLNEELREFLEPNDSDIPFGFLGHSVREALETPFPKWTRRWIGHKPIRCLLTLLSRAVASIRSMTGYPNENATIADDSLRRRTDLRLFTESHENESASWSNGGRGSCRSAFRRDVICWRRSTRNSPQFQERSNRRVLCDKSSARALSLKSHRSALQTKLPWLGRRPDG